MDGGFSAVRKRDRQNLRRFASAADAFSLETDPQISSVVSLLLFMGVDGITKFYDAKGYEWSAFGNAKIDTSLGFNTGYFDGTGDYIRAPTSLNLVGSPFCLELWLNLQATPSATAYLLMQDDGANGNQNFLFSISTGRVLAFTGFSTSARASFWTVDSGSTLVPTGVFQHLCVDYDGTHTRLFIHGVKCGDVTSTHWAGSAMQLAFGSFTDGPNDELAYAKFNGYVRCSRVTAASRYTADFVPPPAPFPMR